MLPEPAVPSTASELVESVPHPDDSGANTADRYEWQAAMAAADGLALYQNSLSEDGRPRPECKDRLLCEWHEDWVLLSDGNVELVSGKHRDPAAGAYTTINKLADDGGLAHLFTRWVTLDETPFCRLVTSGGLASGDPQRLLKTARHFQSLRAVGKPIVINSDHADTVAKLREAIAAHCDETRRRWSGTDVAPLIENQNRDAEVARFLAMLRIDGNQIQRDHVRHAAPNMYVKPLLNQMGVTGSAEAVWEAVLSVFRARMRARGTIPSGELPVVLQRDAGNSTVPPDIRRTVATRTVTMGDIELAITTALAMPGGYEPLPRMPFTSRLGVKMHVGGCSDNAVERALSLRIDYLDYWRDRESGEATARVERKRLERRLQRVTDQATNSTAPQGALLWRRFEAEIDAIEPEILPIGMDTDLAVGGVCDLAGQCKVWFGPRFDVAAVIDRIRTAGEAGP